MKQKKLRKKQTLAGAKNKQRSRKWPQLQHVGLAILLDRAAAQPGHHPLPQMGGLRVPFLYVASGHDPLTLEEHSGFFKRTSSALHKILSLTRTLPKFRALKWQQIILILCLCKLSTFSSQEAFCSMPSPSWCIGGAPLGEGQVLLTWKFSLLRPHMTSMFATHWGVSGRRGFLLPEEKGPVTRPFSEGLARFCCQLKLFPCF